jgi:radical SAM protein with 4Fe4S-binding SPASM domain
MPKERLFSLFQEAHDIGVFEVNPAGGDILLYPDLIEVLEALREHTFLPIRLATKARVTPEMARRLAEVGNVWELQFSIDSTVEDVADFMVRKSGFYRWTMESITNAIHAGLFVSAKAVVTPYNILTIPKLYRDLRHLGVQPVRMASYCRSGFHHSDDLYNTSESFAWLQKQLDGLREEFPDDWVNVQNGEPEFKPLDVETRQRLWGKRNRCTAGRNMMTICSDGKVIPCEQMPESPDIFVGDLMQQSIQEVWDGEPLKTLTVDIPREKYAGTACYDCGEREECHRLIGYCIRDACVYQGSPFAPPTNCPKVEAPFVRRF